MIRLTMKAQEGSTYIMGVEVVEVSSESVETTPIVPKTVSWSLVDDSGSVVNGRSNVPLTPDEIMYVVLTGDDLAIPGGYPVAERSIKVVGTYDSVLFGSDLSFKEQVTFLIENLAGT